MDTLFPASFTWETIQAGITDLIANGVVIGGLAW